MPCCCTHTRGGGNRTQGGEAHGIVVPPVLPRPHLLAGDVRARAVAHRTEQPTEGNKSNGKKAKGTAVRPYSHGPACRRSSSELGRRTSDRATSKWAAMAMQKAPLCARTPTPHLSVERPSSGGAHRTKQNGTKLCMPELPRPRLSAELVRATRQHAQWAKRRGTKRARVGVMRIDVISCRRLQDENWSRYGDIGQIRTGYDSPGA